MSDQGDDDAPAPEPPPRQVPDELPDDSESAIRSSAWWRDGGLRDVLGGGGQQEQNLDQQQPADEPE